MAVYSLLLVLVLVVGAPYWLVRMATSGRYRAGLAGRLGRLPAGLREAVRGREVVWLHAVSVGEVLAALRLLEELRARLPGWAFVVSTTTDTGQRLAKERLGDREVFYLPLDLGFAVRRYLDALRPRMVVLMESELWPRLMVECERRGIPMAVANARVSDRSFPRYMRLRRLWRPLLEKVSVFLAQSEETAERLRRMGAPADRVWVAGNIKYDSRSDAGRPMVRRMKAALRPGTKVVVCGSTTEGEERTLLEGWRRVVREEPGAVMVLAPRHPQRFEAVARLVGEMGLRVVRASGWQEGEEIPVGGVFLLDTIGDLAAMYSVGTAAFVGGGLVRGGGHNPLEAAEYGVPVIMGPSYENFREIVERMRAVDGVRIVGTAATDEQVGAELLGLLRDREGAEGMGLRGREVFLAEAGATARMAERLAELAGRAER